MGAVVGRFGNAKVEAELMAIAFEEEEAAKEEAEARQHKAIKHVVSHIFAFAPVHIKLSHYPKNSRKAGETFVWITIDDAAIRKQERALRAAGNANAKIPVPADCPDGVAVDKGGNIFIAGGKDALKARRITGKDLKYSFDMPPKPKPPRHVRSTPTSIEMAWEALDDDASAVELYELQFRAVGAPESVQWRTITRSVEARASLDDLADALRCYVFRVRAQNSVGWSPFSEPTPPYSAAADVPATPRAPYPGVIGSTFVPLYWQAVDGRGAPVEWYVLAMKSSPGAGFAEVYAGPSTDFVVGGLEPGVTYIFRLHAANAVGSSACSGNSAITTATAAGAEGKSVLPADASSLRDGANNWCECWDATKEVAFYFHKVTGQRSQEQPPEWEESAEAKRLKEEVLFRKKRYRMMRALRGARQRGGHSGAVKIELDRAKLVVDSFREFKKLGAKELQQRMRVEYKGEDGIDSGGLTKDWLLELSRGLLAPKLGLFRELEGGAFEVDGASAQKNEDHLSWFRFIGKVLGKAIFDRQVVDMRFSEIIYLHVLQMPVALEDLERQDPAYAKSLLWMRDNDITDILFESFSVEVGEGDDTEVVDLKEAGRDVDVTEENKEEYIELMVAWRTEFSVRRQLDALLQGFHLLVPEEALAEFSLAEFNVLLNGKPDVDVDELRAFVVFQGGYDVNSQEVLWLWQALRGFTPEYRAKFLRFVTGTSKAPVDGFEPPLNITKSDLPDDALPKAHTCFNQVRCALCAVCVLCARLPPLALLLCRSLLCCCLRVVLTTPTTPHHLLFYPPSQFVLPPYKTFDAFLKKLTFALDNTEGFALA